LIKLLKKFIALYLRGLDVILEWFSPTYYQNPDGTRTRKKTKWS